MTDAGEWERVSVMADLTTKHAITFHADRVTKRFSSWDRGEHEREWRGLTLLAEHAPGLAPRPLTCALTAEPPSITMTRLPGTPLRGTHLDATQTAAVAAAVTRLHEAVPRQVLTAVPPRPWYAGEAAATLRTWYDARPGPHPDPLVERAFGEGARWLAGPDPHRLAAAEPPPVLGFADGNLANYLWDGEGSGGGGAEGDGEASAEGSGGGSGGGVGEGSGGGAARVRLVDFEDSGRSDRAFELAEITEHVSAWSDSHLPAEALLAHFDLTRSETARLRDARRLCTVVWLFLLWSDARAARPRNPPDTLPGQAVRVLERLGCH
ncbi:phosphotransferase [Streptomyces sp. NPDC053542]|uniref:phosphotransferase n=1 Tax=Streptomyces sp. NPDC053542 TaxID=3365710 RepID=UPI0037D6E7B4